MESKDKREKDNPPEDGGWEYKSHEAAAEPPSHDADEPPKPADSGATSVEWTASEYVAHEKGVGWYALLAAAALAIAALIYLLTRDVFSVAVVLIMAVIFGVSSSHKPRVVTYKVDTSGLTVGNKFYPYSAYKSFSVPQEGPFTTVALLPMKHLAFPVGAYLAPDSQDKVIEILSGHLPLEHREPGAVDHLMHRLRF